MPTCWGYVLKGKVEEARKMAKPWTELGDPGEKMVFRSLQEHLYYSHSCFKARKSFTFLVKWTQGEIFMPVASWQLRSVLTQVARTQLPPWKLST